MTVGCRAAETYERCCDQQEVNKQFHRERSSRIGVSRLASSFACFDFDPLTRARRVEAERFVNSMCLFEICE